MVKTGHAVYKPSVTATVSYIENGKYHFDRTPPITLITLIRRSHVKNHNLRRTWRNKWPF